MSPVTIKYSKPGTQPPIFLAGSFAEWQPEEMQYTTDESNEHDFYKEVDVEPGKEYQYKFRIGLGDWWILNEDSPTGTDDAGNRNNVLTVPVADDTIDTKPTEDVPEKASIEMEHHTEQTQPLGAKDMTAESIEEAMGTRETSDVLFDDEIVKDIDTPKDMSLPMTPEPLEPHPTPAFDMGKGKAELKFNDTKKVQEKVADSTKSIEPSTAPAPEIVIETPKDISLPMTPEPLEPHPTPAFDMGKGMAELKNNKQVHDEAAPTPTLVVEKVDEALSHGDDFGPDATVGQKDAHNLRAQDAEPDHTIIRDVHTPELANVAAEVADTAKTLDRNTPTPAISDEEAGRIGFRRMSNTPIPEVANTAAEVADVAATLDNGEEAPAPAPLTRAQIGELLRERGYFAIINDESIIIPETPPEERAPRLPYEGGPAAPVTKHKSKYKPKEPRQTSMVPPPDFDPANPPPGVIVPKDEDILRVIQELQGLPRDTSDYDDRIAGRPEDLSAALADITEENDDDQVNDEQQKPLVKINGSAAKAKEEKPTPTPSISVHGENAKPEIDAIQSPEPILTHSIERSLDGAETSGSVSETGPEAALQSAKPVLTLTKDGSEDVPLPVSPTRIPATPFIVGNRQLGHEDGEVQNITTPSGLSIHVEPATPGGSVDHTPLGVDSGVTTSFEDNGSAKSNTQIRSRKPQSPIPDRPLTPNSMRGKEQSRNFLKAFWRVVFVEWIGGLIQRLCNGGRGRQTLLGVSALALLVSAPTMYQFFLTRLVGLKTRVP